MSNVDGFYRLKGKNTDFVLQCHNRAIPEIVYWGPSLPSDIDFNQWDKMRRGPVPHCHLFRAAPVWKLRDAGRNHCELRQRRVVRGALHEDSRTVS